MARGIDPALIKWRKSLHCLILPHQTLASTLVEMEGKLEAVKGFLATLNPADPAQTVQGVAVGGMALNYAEALLDHFGLVDSEGSSPPPTSLPQAQFVVNNLLAFVNDCLQHHRESLTQGGDNLADESMLVVGGPGPADGPASSDPNSQLIVDRETFTVSRDGQSCSLGNTKVFSLIEFLNSRLGKYVPILTLIEKIWEDDATGSNTVHKTVSNLRKKLSNAGIKGVSIDSQDDHYMLNLS